MSAAREEILARVRAALADVPAAERREPAEIPRAYERGRTATPAHVERFAEVVADYRATVTRLGDDGAVAATIAALADARGARRLAIPADLPEAWRPATLELVPDAGAGLTPRELDGLDGVVSGCAVAIAETGTIVLDAGPAQGRRALTLVPDWHVCVVRAEQVVAGVPEGLAALADAARAGRPITFVSGPSATSDIELSRVEGVHGPRSLDVLIAGA